MTPRGLPKRCALAALVAFLCTASAAAQDDLDDVLGGFEEEDERFEVDPSAIEESGDERFDLSGSVETSGSFNVRSHRSDTGTYYGGLQRLRNRGNLRLDAALPDLGVFEDWQLRLEGWGFYDAAYAIRGRSRYTREVLRQYELDAEVGEAWLHGKMFSDVDVKIGRQVVIWGRSETIRVLDVLNPLDNREPGRVDIEDLRRPLSMLKVVGYAGDWSLAAIAIPEIRFDENPVVGSDFFPGTFEPGEEKPEHFEDVELAGQLTGVFSGWDVSFVGAWFWNDVPRLDGGVLPTKLVHDRLWMVGTGGNYTLGSWLLKSELAYTDGFGFFGEDDEKARLDALVGVEYYGFTDTNIVLEAAHRHFYEHESVMRRAPNFVREDTAEIALRITRNFLRERLRATFVGVALGWDARDGAVLRFDVEYDVLDALTVGAGLLLYQKGDLPPLDTWADNDRLLFSVKWSF